MASGDNVDVIEVVETSFSGPAQATEDHLRPEQYADEDSKSTGDKVTTFESSVNQHGTAGPKTPVGVSRNKSERERKIGHRRVGVGGEITYKKIQTTQIMGSIQLGIQHAVGGLASKPERDLLMQDFMTVETTNFPSEGSNHTPAHHFSEFKFKNYAPIAFRYFRDLFGIQPDDFLMSMCSAPLRELSNPGASGSIFYLTDDDEFIIKTVQHKEGEFLQTLLPGYYMNLNQNPRTLLPKFFGLYCYRCNSKNVRLVAMNNLLPSSVKLHQKYDLKGSTYKRKASKSERSKSSPTYKDLDFMEHHPEGIFLEADTYSALVKTIQRDCRVLESFKIMDYSLLVGLHNLDQAAREKAEQRLSASAEEEVGEVGGESTALTQAEKEREREDRIGASALNRSRSINRQRLVAHSTAMESIQAESEPIDEEDDVPPGGIPARNARGERLLLFLGIIDILQSYRLKKKLEHTWKSMIHDGDTVSVHRPGFYAQRFQDFMAKTVFKKIPSLDLPEIKGNHRKFRNLVTSYIALKHSPSKRKSITRPLRPLDGDFDSTAVPTTGTSTMHATSPTKAVTPTDAAISTTSTVMSTGSAPIAISTPVNFAAGPVSPPPLTLAAGPGLSHHEPPVTTSAAKVTSYPAVLKGRTAASPPNPNLVPSGKIPPPVPPRGTGQSRTTRSSEEHRGPGTATSTSSMTSSRGDEAAIITRYRLHESSSILHHLPTPDYISTVSAASAVTTSTTTSTIYSAATCTTSSLLFSAGTTTTTANCYSDYKNATDTFTTISTTVDTNVLHARTSTPAYLPPRYDSLMFHDRTTDVAAAAFQSIHEEQTPVRWNDRWPAEDVYEEEEEFVSVEKVDGSYVIRTSPYPFRPERGNFKRRERNISTNLEDSVDSGEKRTTSSKADHMAKFTYFLNPASRPELTNYKMSRKDKKHSETYYELMKRKQKELESSITTITTMAQRSKIEATKMDRSGTTISKQEEDPEKKIEVQRLVERRRDSKLLRKIREKSAQRRKKLAPEPSPKAQPFRDPTRVNDNFEYFEKKRKIDTGESAPSSSKPDYGNDGDWNKSTSNVKMLENKENQIVLKSDTRTFLVTKVDEEVPIKLKNIDMVYSCENVRKIDSRNSKTFIVPNKVQVDRANDRIYEKSRSNARYNEQLKKSKNENFNVLKSLTKSDKSKGGTLPSTCSTPPPPFDDAVRSNDQTLASGGQLQQGAPTTILTSSLSSAHPKQNKVVHHVTLTKTYHDAVSISDVHLESSGSGSGSGGRETKSSLSVESGGSSRGGGGLTWTPPAGSAEGSTPTWTEGTPSFTESSSSGDAGCPTTPIRGSQRHDDGGRIAATVEEALASLTTEMKETNNTRNFVEQRRSLSKYSQVRTSFKRASANHVSIMRNVQNVLRVQRREP